MKIDLSKFKGYEVVHCKTKEDAELLIKLCQGNEDSKWVGYWSQYEENTGYLMTEDENKISGYSAIEWFKKKGYRIFELSDILISELIEIPKVFNILDLEIGCELDINGYNANPCIMDNEYVLKNSLGNIVSGNWIVKMINGTCTYVVKKRKKMTLKEIESQLNCLVTIVEE